MKNNSKYSGKENKDEDIYFIKHEYEREIKLQK